MSLAWKGEEEFSNQTGREEHARDDRTTGTGHRRAKKLRVTRDLGRWGLAGKEA